MENLILQLENLLTTPPGNLLYHLVLIFSVSTVMQAALGLSAIIPSERRNRIISGAVLLLVLQVILFVNSAFAWQGVEDATFYLPSIDRSVITVSYIWVLWMWNFPKASRFADRITIALSIAVIALLVFSVTAWKTQLLSIAFNNTLLDWSWSVLYTIILVSGVLLVLVHRPPAWGIALAFLNINLLGALAHMLWASPNSDFSAALRIAQLCSFPLLPGMVYRQQKVPEPEPRHRPEDEKIVRKTQPDWLSLTIPESPKSFLITATRLIAADLDALCCLWLYPSPGTQQEVLGYNREKDRVIQKTVLETKGLTAVRKALTKNQPTLIEANPLTKHEISEVSKTVTGSNSIEQLYFYPVIQEGDLLGLFIIASQAPSAGQSAQAEELLKQIQKSVAVFLKNHEKQERLSGKQEALERELFAAHHQLNRQQEEIVSMKRKIEDFQSVISIQNELEGQINQLETENLDLKAATASTMSVSAASDINASDNVPFINLIDRVIDETSSLLLERDMILKLDIPNNVTPILLEKGKADTYHVVLKNLFCYICDAAIENESIGFQVLLPQNAPGSVQVIMKTSVVDDRFEPGVNSREVFRAFTQVIRSLTGIEVVQSRDGNFLLLDIVLKI